MNEQERMAQIRLRLLELRRNLVFRLGVVVGRDARKQIADVHQSIDGVDWWVSRIEGKQR